MLLTLCYLKCLHGFQSFDLKNEFLIENALKLSTYSLLKIDTVTFNIILLSWLQEYYFHGNFLLFLLLEVLEKISIPNYSYIREFLQRQILAFTFSWSPFQLISLTKLFFSEWNHFGNPSGSLLSFPGTFETRWSFKKSRELGAREIRRRILGLASC